MCKVQDIGVMNIMVRKVKKCGNYANDPKTYLVCAQSGGGVPH